MNSLDLKKLLHPVTVLIHDNISLLTELDSVTGDGDHGITMGKIADTIEKTMNQLTGDENVADVLEDLSWDVMNVNGGSAGPLWGAFIEGMSNGARLEATSNEMMIRNILLGAYDEFFSVSGAVVGDKTMMDAIYPATEVIRQGSLSNFNQTLSKAALEAERGAEATKEMLAKFGRARSIKEKAIGHRDPGAVSFSLLYKGVAESYQ